MGDAIQDELNIGAAPRLGLGDAVSLVIGIVVGTSIFRTAPEVFQNTSGPWPALGAWFLGGMLSIIGAFCYAELATTYTRAGGDYEYLTRAFGPWAGFLFGWAQLTAVLTSSIGTMAYTFADYGVKLFRIEESGTVWLATAPIVAATVLNALGTSFGKTTQNICTVAKVAGLIGVVLAGIVAADWTNLAFAPLPSGERTGVGVNWQAFGLAMVFVLYAYGGWNDAAFVAAEVRDRKRNLPLALIGGVLGVTAVYLAVNVAYLVALGFDAARATRTPATDVIEAAIGRAGGNLASILVMISALGAINGMVLVGSRVYAAAGADHRPLRWLSGWDAQRGAPRAALLAQAAVSLAMVFAVSLVDPSDGFGTLLAATAPVFWSFLMGTGASVIILRWRDPLRERPFAVPLYPLPPLIFCATCGYMLYSSLSYALSKSPWLPLMGIGPVAAGLAVYLLTPREKSSRFAS
ncbi:APC family permease [Lacipirellula limnantheis]|uniref:Serine/threonine exchanger SteT n=1 Tax=Lacipirellula limnantheis TaxID=2528024 RepID=A0A517TRU5_9BACT|nr:amino acid permease [Lacipirellula limnantheis]QDT71096.1 Serine/threonine exchanger SteT [Lacipirellula limnantheis]